MARRAEDMMRRMMGMPSRKEEERARRKAGRESRSGGSSTHRCGEGTRRHHRQPQTDAADLLNSVAEDVEFTEIREFDSTTIISDDTDGHRVEYREEQVSDAEYVEIKK